MGSSFCIWPSSFSSTIYWKYFLFSTGLLVYIWCLYLNLLDCMLLLFSLFSSRYSVTNQRLDLLFSCSVVSDFLYPCGLKHARFPCPSPSLRTCLNSCPLSQWCHPTILSSVIPLLLLPSVFPRNRVSSSELTLCIRQSKYWNFSVSPSNEYSNDYSVLLMTFFQNWLVWSPCSPRDSQGSSPVPQFKNTNSLMLSLLYGLALMCVYDYWKNHSFD